MFVHWGVLLDTSFSSKAQVISIVRSALYQLILVCQLWPYLDQDNFATAVHALRQDCCNVLHVRLPLDLAQKLLQVQNSVARLLVGTDG